MIPKTKNIWRIPICNIFYHRDEIGNFLDLLICAVNEKDISAVSEQTSLNDILSLELSNRAARSGQCYRIYGYPTREFEKNGASYRSVGHEILGRLTKRHTINDDDNNIFDIPSSAYPIEVCEIEILGNSYGGHGFSGSPVVDEENKVVGIIFGCSDDFQTFYFFPNNILQAILCKVVVKWKRMPKFILRFRKIHVFRNDAAGGLSARRRLALTGRGTYIDYRPGRICLRNMKNTES